MEFLVILVVIAISLGTLFFMLGYGALFLGAFSHNSRISVVLLIILGFSSVGFVYFDKPWYYSLPFWLLPVIYAHIALPLGRNKKLAIIGFWLGLSLFAGGIGLLAYTATQNADIKATIEKYKAKKAMKQVEKEKQAKQKAQQENKGE